MLLSRFPVLSEHLLLACIMGPLINLNASIQRAEVGAEVMDSVTLTWLLTDLHGICVDLEPAPIVITSLGKYLPLFFTIYFSTGSEHSHEQKRVDDLIRGYFKSADVRSAADCVMQCMFPINPAPVAALSTRSGQAIIKISPSDVQARDTMVWEYVSKFNRVELTAAVTESILTQAITTTDGAFSFSVLDRVNAPSHSIKCIFS